MNPTIMQICGFGNETQLIKEGKCPFCKKVIVMEDFLDSLSRREYEISGLCQSCQDKFFKSGK